MMKWAQPLGTPRAVLTNYNYTGNSSFALPLSKMMQCELFQSRLPPKEWLQARHNSAPLYFTDPEDSTARHGKCCVCQRGRCLGRCPNPKCGLLMHISCAPMTMDGSSFICPVCKAHDGLSQVESLATKEIEPEDLPYWHEAEVGAAVKRLKNRPQPTLGSPEFPSDRRPGEAEARLHGFKSRKDGYIAWYSRHPPENCDGTPVQYAKKSRD